jgi:hypothetical protein
MREDGMAKRVATSIVIAAPPERVWHVLTDFARYGEWNPFIRAASGGLALGGRLQVTIAPPGGAPMTFKPVVSALQPNRLLCWKGCLFLRGLFDGDHQFRLIPTSSGTVLEHQEQFTGILPALMGDEAFARIESGFNLMNDAFRQRTEAQVREASET